MADDLAELEPFFAAYLNRFSPAQRKRLLRKVGEETRRINAKRIAANVDPDGAAMQPRKPRKRMKDRKSRIKRMGKMFPKNRLARILKVQDTEDQAEVGIKAGTDFRIASVHQYDEVDSVGRTRGGQIVKTRYPARRLLGFGPDDLEAITDQALKLLEE